jgi:adenine phosphoribosyltransferase
MATSISTQALDRLYAAVRDVPDFPKPGIVFKDITPLLLNHELFSEAVSRIANAFRDSRVEKVLAIESRGFIFGAPVAHTLGAGLALARKMGKLPWDRHRVEYELEYGTDVIEIHKDAILPGERVLIIDDVLATGGTARAAAQIVREAGGALAGLGFLVELSFLDGRSRLGSDTVWSLLSFPRSD